eukprot:TRINITY_DN20182_c0_g1_i1.p1 TRINITY_DN20182_c0_g1~~TRINITY_DN20182_c0_g1_i1.p1  ORF type:complete len:290 (-),score=46.65 TRINITY_DN20182_c0_g1_i1:63-932(-)
MSSASSSTCLAVEACFQCWADATLSFCCASCSLPGNVFLCARCARAWGCWNCGAATEEDFAPAVQDDVFTLMSGPSSVDGVTVSLSSSSSLAGRGLEETTGQLIHAQTSEITKRTLLFVAVPGELKDVILQEGFKTRKRNHVPAAGTQEHALAAFRSSSRSPSVLAVASLHDGTGQPYTVTRTGRHGCRIWTPGLPRHCLSDVGSVLYVAVPRALRDRILQEGYRPSRRRSVPASISREAAALVYGRHSSSPYEVLGVLTPANLPRRSHKGGYKLSTPLLAGEFLRQLL